MCAGNWDVRYCLLRYYSHQTTTALGTPGLTCELADLLSGTLKPEMCKWPPEMNYFDVQCFTFLRIVQPQTTLMLPCCAAPQWTELGQCPDTKWAWSCAVMSYKKMASRQGLSFLKSSVWLRAYGEMGVPSINCFFWICSVAETQDSCISALLRALPLSAKYITHMITVFPWK